MKDSLCNVCGYPKGICKCNDYSIDESEAEREYYRGFKDSPSFEDALTHRGLNKHPQSREFKEAVETGIISNAPVVNKYSRECKGVMIDVYDVLKAFDVRNSALQHLIKKALCTGIRGHKNKEQDLQDIIDSAVRAKELEE